HAASFLPAAGAHGGGGGSRAPRRGDRGFPARFLRHAPARGGGPAEGVTMAIPPVYNVNSVRERWPSAVVAVLGIAGTVAVFVAMLAMARGFQATRVFSGSPTNVVDSREGTSCVM